MSSDNQEQVSEITSSTDDNANTAQKDNVQANETDPKILDKQSNVNKPHNLGPEEGNHIQNDANSNQKEAQATQQLEEELHRKLASIESSNEDVSSYQGYRPRMPCEDDYEVIKLISNGAYAAVYLVRHKETRQRFAMKKINKHNLILRNQEAQAFAERDIGLGLSMGDNPFVVSMYCSFETKKHLCLVMEYVEGGDVATLLKQMGPLPVDMARFYFAETVLAVEYLHDHGIVHRDLKPDNLLLTGMGHIKLTDFGLSKMGLMNLTSNLYEGYRKDKEFNDKQVYGTPEYIAPEVILKQGYGKPVDWWSCGIILYELLIGCVPFFGETPEELFSHVVKDELEWPPDDDWPLPPEARDMINKLLVRDPKYRLGTGGPHEVKNHPFFHEIDFQDVLRQKAEFIPHLEGDEDTSYFDTRSDRYNHELEDSEDLDDTDDSSSVFSSFSSCSPRYRKLYSRVEKELEQESLLRQSSSSSSLREELKVTRDPQRYARSDSLHSDGISRTSSVTEESVPSPKSMLSVIITETPVSSAEKQKNISAENSSQNDSDASPQIQRKPLLNTKDLPKFSFSLGEDEQSASEQHPPRSPRHTVDALLAEPASTVDTLSRKSSLSSSGSFKRDRPSLLSSNRISIPNSASSARSRGAVIKSASASGLSLIVCGDDKNKAAQGKKVAASPGGSSASSRDASPNRDISTLTSQLKPPIILTKGPRGFGFSLRAIRVYYGDSDVYTIHHLISSVCSNSPAFEAGLRPGDLLTHINGEPVQGLLHHQVLQLMLSGGDKVNIRTVPLESTTIRPNGRKRDPVRSRMARRPLGKKHHKMPHHVKRSDSDKKRRNSLLKRLSSRRASATFTDSQQLPCPNAISPVMPESSQLNCPQNRLLDKPRSPPSHRICISDSSAANSSSQSSSPASSVPNSPASSNHSPLFPRPSSLHGLQHKRVQNIRSPRRKSCGHIPLSPLARTPSPQVILQTASPNRSPSPLAFPLAHQPGSSQTVQTYQHSKSATCSAVASSKKSGTPKGSVASLSPKLTKNERRKSADLTTSLLRLRLSPDRLRVKRGTTSGNVCSPLAMASSPPVTQAEESKEIECKVEPTNESAVSKKNEEDNDDKSSATSESSVLEVKSSGSAIKSKKCQKSYSLSNLSPVSNKNASSSQQHKNSTDSKDSKDSKKMSFRNTFGLQLSSKGSSKPSSASSSSGSRSGTSSPVSHLVKQASQEKNRSRSATRSSASDWSLASGSRPGSMKETKEKPDRVEKAEKSGKSSKK